MSEETVKKKGFFIPTWMIAIVALALIAGAAVQFGGNTSPVTSTQSAINAEPSGSSSSGSSGTGNTGVGSENDSTPIKGVRFVTPGVTNQNELNSQIITKPNSGQILEGDTGSSIDISIYKEDIGKLSINNVRGKTLKNFRSQQYGDTTVIYADISNPLKNKIVFNADLLIKPIASPEMSAGRARETVTANGEEVIVLRFPSEGWNKASVLWLRISIGGLK